MFFEVECQALDVLRLYVCSICESIMDLHWLLKRLITWNKYILNARVLSLNHGFWRRNISFPLLKVFKDCVCNDVLWFDDITAMSCGLLGTAAVAWWWSSWTETYKDTMKETDGILSVFITLVSEQIANFTFLPWNKKDNQLLISQLTLFSH